METAGTDKSPEITHIGKYDVIEVLGRGGMGIVYRAVDKHLGREVAIKKLTQGIGDDPAMLTRFYAEGRRMGRLKHPNIVTIYDLGEEDGIPYIVMERVEGSPLDRLIPNANSVSMIDRLRIIEEVCSALGYAHSNNVIHRDVKPANILVQPDGNAKLLDFGIARLEKRSQEKSLTRAGHIIGTIPYIAPERFQDKFVDGRSDIFSVGVVLYQLISGQLPFSGEDYVVIQKIMNEPHPPLSSLCENYPVDLEVIVDKALAKSAEDRYQTAEEMAADLNSVIEDLRQKQLVELLPQARQFLEQDDLTRARAMLQQVLKVHSKNTEAKQMLAEIQRKLFRKQRDERRDQLSQLANDALGRKEFEQSASFIKEGLELDSSSVELLALREKVQQEKKKQERIEEYIRQADAARRKGDYKAAIASAQEALLVDKSNSKVIVLCKFLAAEAEQAQRKSQAKTLLDKARRQLEARFFDETLELLKKVEELDPSEAEVQLLRVDANAGLEQSRRKDLIVRLEEKVSLANTLEQFHICTSEIREAMATLPAESALFRLKARVDRHVHELENSRLVEDTIQACRDLGSREALDVVRRANERLPGDERLMSLEARLKERIQKQSVEERRAEYHSRARDCLKDSRFADAVHILEGCEAENLADNEILALLEFVRGEEAEQIRQNLKRLTLEKAQRLVNEGIFEEAVVFIEKAIAQSDDTGLRLLLRQAKSAHDETTRQVDTALASAEILHQARKIEEAIQLLRMLPANILRIVRVQASIAALEDELNMALFRMSGRAYALLGTDLIAGHAIIQRVNAASFEGSSIAALATAVRSREEESADRVLEKTAQIAENLFRRREKLAAEDLIHRTEEIAALASPEGRSKWQSFATQINKKGLLSRLRG